MGKIYIRRSKKEIEFLLKKFFNIESEYYDLHETDYQRSYLINMLKLSKLLSIFFLKSHPYLNIYKLKIKNMTL